ncbi:MAG: hypothetical protein AAF892_05410 [Cyanobacteria bacterium P01_D01_bin.71]
MNKRVSFQQRAIAHLKAFLAVCFAVLFCLSSLAAPAWANRAVDAYTFTPAPAPAAPFAAVLPTDPCSELDIADCNNGDNGGARPSPSTAVDINFGVGDNSLLTSIVVGGDTYFPDSISAPPNGLSDRLVFRRSSDPALPERSVLFHEIAPGSTFPLASPIDVIPEVANNLEEGMLSLISNRGVDNIFNNISTSGVATNAEETTNNIERVDYIVDGGLNVPVATRGNLGFLILERGGNDPFRVAAITGLDGAGDPSSYGPLIEQPLSGGGSYGGAIADNITTFVARDDDLAVIDPIIQPSHTVAAQDVRGRFFRIDDLLPAADTTTTTIFGYSIFADDVPFTANLVDFESFPTDTVGAGPDAPGGLDLVAGGAVLSIQPAPEIGVAKTVSAPRAVGGSPGFFDFDLTLQVTNTGNTVLNNVQLTEDLTAALINGTFTTPAADFNPANTFSLVGTPTIDASGVTGAAPTNNPGYNGTNTTPGTTDVLFAAGNSFNVNDTATVTITVRVELGDIGGAAPALDGILVADNQASASGTSPGNQTVTDLSEDGGNVDPDNDGDPTNNDTPTRIQIPFPSIGVAKSISDFRPVAGTTQFDFDFTIIVTNTGSTVLDNVTLQENLQDALITSATNQVDSFSVLGTPTLTSTGFTGTPPTANTAYNGVGDIEVFAGTNSFNAGDSTTAVITVRADLGAGGAGPLNDGAVIAQNTATASGTPSGPGVPPGTGPVSDSSQTGGSVDPDGDGNPANNNDPTPIQFPATGVDLVLVKRITNIFRGGVAQAVPGITSFNDQPGDPNDNDTLLNTALGGGNQLAGIFQLPIGFELLPNDEVEYTVFLWNSSVGTITQLNICDELQAPSVLNTAAGFELATVGPLGTPTFGGAGSTVQGRSPGAPLESFCPSAPGSFPLGPPGPTGGLGVGAGGGVIAGPFTVPTNQFGAFRFRVRIP